MVLLGKFKVAQRYAVHNNVDLFANVAYKSLSQTTFSDYIIAEASHNTKMGANFMAVIAGLTYNF